MDDDACSISYGDWSEEKWWMELMSPRTEQTFQEKHGSRRVEPRSMQDHDPPAQPPRPLEPLEHGPMPLLDASEG